MIQCTCHAGKNYRKKSVQIDHKKNPPVEVESNILSGSKTAQLVPLEK